MESVRRAVRGIALVLPILACTACERGEPSPLPAAKGGGGELRVALPIAPRTFDPNSLEDEAALLLAPSLFNKLVALDADSRLLPDLAESWTVSPDGTRYTFRLREGVRWHDGRPFSAADVEWSLEALGGDRSPAAEAFSRIAGIDAPDSRTVVVHLREPWAPFLPTFALGGTFILPRHRFAGRSPRQWRPEDRPVGTGPFRFAEWVRGERIVLDANPDFFRTGPFLDRLIFLPRARRAVDRLLAGEVDYVVRPGIDRLPELSRAPQVRVVTRPSEARYYVAFNLRRRHLKDRRVREAINRAIDRQEILEQALRGYGVPAFGFYTPAVAWAYNGEALAPPYAPDRARALLDAAGLRTGPGGVRVVWNLVSPDLPPFPEMARLLVEQMRAVGVELRPIVLTNSGWIERILRHHDFDLTFMAGIHGPDPENLNSRFGSRGPIQFMGYSSPEFDAAVAQGTRTLDTSRRAAAYFRAQEILARDLPIAPLAEAVHVAAFRRNVRGLFQVEARGLVPVFDFSLVRVEP